MELQNWEYVTPLANSIKLCLLNSNQDYKPQGQKFFDETRQKIEELRQFRNKTEKSHRIVDLLSGAFPDDKYDLKQEAFLEIDLYQIAMKQGVCNYILKSIEIPRKINEKEVNAQNIVKIFNYYNRILTNTLNNLIRNISDYDLRLQQIDELKKKQYEQEVDLDQIKIQICKEAFQQSQVGYNYKLVNNHRYKLFDKGVEIYRTRNDNIKNFCISRNHDCVILQGKTIKTLNVKKQFEQEAKNEVVSIIQNGFKDNKDYQIFSRRTNLQQMYDSLSDKDHRERFQSFVHKSVTDFSDYQTLVAHPYQNLYMMGTRGIIDIFSFQSYSYISELQSGQKEIIDKIKFNNHADLLLCNDSSYNSFIWQISRNTKQKLPIYSMSGKARPASDLTFMNEGSVFASIHKNNIGIYDILLPSTRNNLYNDTLSGNQIHFSQRTNSLYLCNYKKNTISSMDIRMFRVVQNIDSQFELKDTIINNYQDQLICGSVDGTVKIINLLDTEQSFDIHPFKFGINLFPFLIFLFRKKVLRFSRFSLIRRLLICWFE